MNVLHVIAAVAPRYGGPSHAVVGMGRALREHGVNVLIATTDADGPQSLPVVCGDTSTWQSVPAIFFHREWSESFKYCGALAAWLGKHVAEFDVVHVHAVFSHASVAAANAARKHRVPYIVRPLGTLDPWSLRQKPFRKQILWHFGVKSMLRQAAAIHYTTASEQKLAEAPLKLKRGVVIPLGVDPELFEAATAHGGEDLTEENPYVLVLGRLHPKKGLEMFIDAFRQVVARSIEFERWRLVIAGDGDPQYVAGLRELIGRHDLADKVLLPGWVGGSRKAQLLRNSALLALTSRQENFGIVVAEALACGTPVLVSKHVNLSDEILGADAGWVVPLEEGSIVTALCEALSDDDERVRRGAAGRQLALREFAWPSAASALEHLYQRVSCQGTLTPALSQG